MKLRRIVVCMDEDPESNQALEESIAIARKVGAEIVLVHVGELYDDYPDLDKFDHEDASAAKELLALKRDGMRAQLTELRERHIGQGVEISVSLVPGDPGKAIAEASTELDADLIVVGSHGRTGFRRLISGSVAERVVRRADRSVLVARNDGANLPYRRILVATDFSEASERALETALLFAEADADVVLFHSWQLPSASTGTSPLLGKIAQGIEARANEDMDELIRKFEGDYVLRKEIVFGHPGHLIRERAAECDLVALGCHGYKGLTRYVLGSVAELTVRHAPCSVLVAR